MARNHASTHPLNAWCRCCSWAAKTEPSGCWLTRSLTQRSKALKYDSNWCNRVWVIWSEPADWALFHIEKRCPGCHLWSLLTRRGCMPVIGRRSNDRASKQTLKVVWICMLIWNRKWDKVEIWSSIRTASCFYMIDHCWRASFKAL